MTPKSTATPLLAMSGNSRTRGSGKKSQKAKENEAQKKDGFLVLEDMPDTDITIIPETQLEPQSSTEASTRLESKIDAITAIITLLRAEVNASQARVVDLEKVVLGLEKRLEQQQVEIHELREHRATVGPRLSPSSSYAAVIGSAHGPLISEGLSARIISTRAEELFCTVDFSRVENDEGTTTVDPAALRKRIKEEMHKQDEKFRVKTIIKDRRSPNRLRILCRNEEELKNVKSAAVTTAVQGACVLRDQLYPVKINNARADAILMPDGSLKPNIASEIAEENGTEIAKVAWLSTKSNERAYGSLIAYFTKGSESTRFLREGYMYVGRESAVIKPFIPNEGPPRYYNCQSFGHKAFNCQSEKKCGNCAQLGHS